MNVREWKTTLNDEIMAPTEAHVQISTFSTPSFSEKFLSYLRFCVLGLGTHICPLNET